MKKALAVSSLLSLLLVIGYQCLSNQPSHVQGLDQPSPSHVLIKDGILELAHPHDPQVFYKNRFGLWVGDGFLKEIVAKAKPVATGFELIHIHRLVSESSDEDIQVWLGKKNQFSESEVCWILAQMLADEQDERVGELENTGRANLFYTPSGVVMVKSEAFHRWVVEKFKRDANHSFHSWGKGSLVFFTELGDEGLSGHSPSAPR